MVETPGPSFEELMRRPDWPLTGRDLYGPSRPLSDGPSDGLIEVEHERRAALGSGLPLDRRSLAAVVADFDRTGLLGPVPTLIEVAPDVWSFLRADQADERPLLAPRPRYESVPVRVVDEFPAGGWRLSLSDGSLRANFERTVDVLDTRIGPLRPVPGTERPTGPARYERPEKCRTCGQRLVDGVCPAGSVPDA